MKFVHIADMHFDSPFSSLSDKDNLGDKRRLEQRNAFRKMIDFIKENNIEYLFIAGDLIEHEYIRKSTIDYINSCFEEISNTKIFITPGNHDPYIKGSYYNSYEFSKNVYIFKDASIDVFEDENVRIYGMAFNDFYMNNSALENIGKLSNDKLNILVAHADLNGAKDKDGFSYNPILESKLVSYGFDYIALGHIHKNNLDNLNRIYYPGSTISLGFDELGSHGMIVGEIDKNSFRKQFIALDDREFVESRFDISKISSEEELIEKISKLSFDSNNLYKIILSGYRNFDINAKNILKLIDINNVLKLKDDTSLKIDIESLMNEENLKGYFVRSVIEKHSSGECTLEEAMKAIEIGLRNM